MFDFIAHGVALILFIAFLLVIAFGLWILWQIRALITTGIRAAREAGLRARNDTYTREQLYKNIAYYELRGDEKATEYWQEILDRKYPHA